ncbi:MAG TPA: GNAT family N-acetyltransferase [Acidimicrobiales bacterium]|nr:GNAT family N-acetyltransferase [Acidimicrobiales bacterium]
MAIREATADDLAEILSLIRELADYEEMADDVVFDAAEVGQHLFGDRPAASVLLAVDDDTGAVAGFALWFRTFSTFLGRPGIWLEDLFVRPAFRHRGHGLALLQRLRTITDGRVEWAVLDWNEPAIRFYGALGAQPVEGWTQYRWAPD